MRLPYRVFPVPDRIQLSIVGGGACGGWYFPSRFLSQLLPQNPCLIRSWYVNARSMTEPSEMEGKRQSKHRVDEREMLLITGAEPPRPLG